MKNTFRILLALFLMTAMMCVLPACSFFGLDDGEGSSSGSSADKQELEAELESELGETSDIENPTYKNEQDGAVVKEKKSDEKDFYGNWEAASDRAEYLYGNLNISIRPDHTWKANITDEDFNGTWDYNGTGITISSEIINADLFYADDGALMFKDHDYPLDMLVLTKAK